MHELKVRAELNEYIYYKLKETRITTNIDEDIGAEFLLMSRATSR